MKNLDIKSNNDKINEKKYFSENSTKAVSFNAKNRNTHDTVLENNKKSNSKNTTQKDKEKSKKARKQKSWVWSLKITIATLLLALVFSYFSDLTAQTENIVVTILLLVFLILGSIFFDGIGVAVTACELTPLVSMSSRKIYGAKTATKLVKNANKVSSICSDVIGDIFGIISGACSIVIVLAILKLTKTVGQEILTMVISSIVAALTVGGKAFIKNIAIKNSKEMVMFVARIVGIFDKDERKSRTKKARKKNEKNTNNK